MRPKANPSPSFLTHPRTWALVLALSAAVFLFYLATVVFFPDVYRYAVAGAVYELLALPMLALLVALPITSILLLVNRQTPWLYPVLSLVLTMGSILVLIKSQ